MKQVIVDDAKTHSSDRAERVAAEEGSVERRPGRAKGRITIAVDFDAPLPPDIAQAFGAEP